MTTRRCFDTTNAFLKSQFLLFVLLFYSLSTTSFSFFFFGGGEIKQPPNTLQYHAMNPAPVQNNNHKKGSPNHLPTSINTSINCLLSDGSASRQAKLLTERAEGVGNKVVLLEHSKEIYLLSPCEKSLLYGQVGLDVESVSSLMALDESNFPSLILYS